MKYTEHFRKQVEDSAFVQRLREGVVLSDNSEFTQWDGCFAAGVYNGALKRVSARSRTPLAFGAAVHAGLESYFKKETIDIGEGLPQRPIWMDKALACAAEEELDAAGDPKRNTDKLADLLSAYVMEYERMPSMQFDIIKIDNIPQVEQSFVVPLGYIDLPTPVFGHSRLEVQWSGKMDLLTRYDGGIAPVDHKTTSIMGEKFLDDKLRSSQMLGYTYATRWLAQHVFENMPVYGVRINALAMRTSGYEFKQFAIPLADWKIAEWQSETLLSVKEKVLRLDHFLRTAEIAPTREHCVTKYGKCPYFDVCDAAPTMRDRMIFDDSYFYVTDWSPLNE